MNYWTLAEAELVKIVKERDLAVDTSNINRKEIIAAIKKSDMLMGTATEPLVEDDATGEIIDMPPELKLRRIRFHNTREDDLNYVFVGLNGRSFYLPREKDINIPQVLLDSCIKDAIETHLDPFRQDGKIVFRKKLVQRFPYTLLN